MEYIEQLKNKIEENFEEQLNCLKELVAIESVVLEGNGKKPFGEGVNKAFHYVLSKGEKMGFESENIDNYGGHLDFGGYEYDEEGTMIGVSDETMGIICHLDTVPLGNDWSHEPLACEIANGKIFGRGTNDDKGPTVAVLYAMKALKDCEIEPIKKVRLILGLDEETNWEGMEKYLEQVKPPTFGFTPDADFPAINGEKGILVFDIAKKFGKTTNKGLNFRSFKGGFAPNMVADFARVVVNSQKLKTYENIKGKVIAWREEGKAKIYSRFVGKSMEITVQGISAHGARPEYGENAISQMMEFLSTLSFTNDDINDFIEFYNKHIGYELNGESLGCLLEDQVSGQTILNVGQIEMDTKSVRLTINIRYPVTCNQNQIYSGMDEVCRKYNLGIVKHKHDEPVFIPKDDPFIVTLMNIYKEHTGDRETESQVIGGGTYARAFKDVIAFGCRFPGEKDVAHQKDEYISLERLKQTTLIYADAIYRLACENKESRNKDGISS